LTVLVIFQLTKTLAQEDIWTKKGWSNVCGV